MGKKKKGTMQLAAGEDGGEAGAAASGGSALVLSSDTTACGQCGIRNSDLKSCGGCFQVAYCSKECQATGWKVHKKRCKEESANLALASLSLVEGNPLAEFWFQPPGGGAALNTRQARAHVALAHEEERWEEVMRCVGAIDTLLTSKEFDDAERHNVAGEFSSAAQSGRDWALAARCCKEQVEILGRLQRFRNQGAAICRLAAFLRADGDPVGARKENERAR
jgi:hypothetical protein